MTAPKAHIWCTTVPTEPHLKLRDHEYMFSTRLRLGLKPIDHLGNQCKACRNNIESDPNHYLSCNLKASGAITARHNLVVKSVAHLVDMAGGTSRSEPAHFSFQESKSTYKRTDLEAILGNRHIILDVSVTTPTCRHAIDNLMSSTEQLGAAKRTAIHKTNKHIANAEYIDAKFVPFILESYGGMIPECGRFLSSLQSFAMDNVSTSTCHRLSSQLFSSIAIAVQRGNAIIAQKCIQTKSDLNHNNNITLKVKKTQHSHIPSSVALSPTSPISPIPPTSYSSIYASLL